MHVPGHHTRTCPGIVPGPDLPVDSQVPVPRAEVHDGGTMVSELTSFSLTVHRRRNGMKMRLFSNFGWVIRALYGRKTSAEVPKAPGQAVLDVFG